MREIRFYNKFLDKKIVKAIKEYPNCPFYCSNCDAYKGRFICKTCNGIRELASDGITCECPKGYEDDGRDCLKITDNLVALWEFEDSINLSLRDTIDFKL